MAVFLLPWPFLLHSFKYLALAIQLFVIRMTFRRMHCVEPNVISGIYQAFDYVHRLDVSHVRTQFEKLCDGMSIPRGPSCYQNVGRRSAQPSCFGFQILMVRLIRVSSSSRSLYREILTAISNSLNIISLPSFSQLSVWSSTLHKFSFSITGISAKSRCLKVREDIFYGKNNETTSHLWTNLTGFSRANECTQKQTWANWAGRI